MEHIPHTRKEDGGYLPYCSCGWEGALEWEAEGEAGVRTLAYLAR